MISVEMNHINLHFQQETSHHQQVKAKNLASRQSAAVLTNAKKLTVELLELEGPAILGGEELRQHKVKRTRHILKGQTFICKLESTPPHAYELTLECIATTANSS